MKKTMKVMVMLLCVVSMAVMSACSKEESYQRKIVGTWENVRMYGTNSDGEYVEELFESGETVYTFNSDGSFILSLNDGEDVSNGTYCIVDNDKLLLTQIIALQFDIQELTNSKMVLKTSLFGGNVNFEFKKIN